MSRVTCHVSHVLDGIDYIGWRLIVLDVLDHMGLY